jgi:hypothetical protein
MPSCELLHCSDAFFGQQKKTSRKILDNNPAYGRRYFDGHVFLNLKRVPSSSVHELCPACRRRSSPLSSLSGFAACISRWVYVCTPPLAPVGDCVNRSGTHFDIHFPVLGIRRRHVSSLECDVSTWSNLMYSTANRTCKAAGATAVVIRPFRWVIWPSGCVVRQATSPYMSR